MKKILRLFIKSVIYDYLYSNYVECYECHCLTNRNYAQTVTMSYYADSGFGNRYYCAIHKQPYTQVQLSYAGIKYYKTIESQTIEVTKTGKPIKRKK